MLRRWQDRPLADLLAEHDLTGVPERAFPNDGWSGSQLTLLQRGSERFVLKRTSGATDWIVRATDDEALREAFVAAGALRLPDGVTAPYLGAAADGPGAALLMPDLTGTLLDWGRPIDEASLGRVLRYVADIHSSRDDPASTPWCPLRERLGLLSRPSAERYEASGLPVGRRFLDGWDAFDRLADPRARELVARLGSDASPLLDALGRLPSVLLHGDLKLANVGFRDRSMVVIDWQMVMRAPVAVELGWLLVSNVAALPVSPTAIVERYFLSAVSRDVALGDWEAQVDLTWIVGLLLRGWRKGLDAEAGTPTGWGASAAEDLEWWSRRAVEGAERRL